MDKLLNWFVPHDAIRGRSNIEMARIFVFTHLFGPAIASPTAVYLFLVTPQSYTPIYILLAMISSFILLPFVLRFTGNMMLVSLLSFQGLAMSSLFGTYHFGGISSPFLPWLVVSLLLGFFYLSKHITLVVTIFTMNVAIFVLLSLKGFPSVIPVEDLQIVSWMSIVAAGIYMSWMALYYSRMMAMRTELSAEAARFRHTMEELDKARSRAVVLSENRSRFFSKMSHELRTPLNAIIGYSEIILEECEDMAEPEADQLHADLKRINSAGKHLLSLVSDVLDFDSLDDNADHINPSEFTIETVIEEILANARPLVERNNNRLEISCPHPDHLIRTDRRYLRQIVINLLSNAGKFTENGRVKLDIEIDSDLAEERLLVRVSDTGVGMSQEAMSRLFTEFEQADDTISHRYGGTGIGLALSQKFAILLGGAITVESTENVGSTFTVEISAQLETRLQEELKHTSQGKAGYPNYAEAA